VLGLGPEPGQSIRLAGLLGVQQFDRHGPAQGKVGAVPHRTHAAGRDACIEPVPAVQYLTWLCHTAPATRARQPYPGPPAPIQPWPTARYTGMPSARYANRKPVLVRYWPMPTTGCQTMTQPTFICRASNRAAVR
jgi:hypothetical protein